MARVKDEDMDPIEVKQEALKKEEEVLQPADESLKKFTQLWFAAYFERKLTRAKVTEADLPQIVADLVSYFSSAVNQRVDFRRAGPLLLGLHNLFVRRLNYLVKDSQQTLKEMAEPLVQIIKEEGEAQLRRQR